MRLFPLVSGHWRAAYFRSQEAPDFVPSWARLQLRIRAFPRTLSFPQSSKTSKSYHHLQDDRVCSPRWKTLSKERAKPPAGNKPSEFAGCSQICSCNSCKFLPKLLDLIDFRPLFPCMGRKKFKSSPPAEEFQVRTGQLAWIFVAKLHVFRSQVAALRVVSLPSMLPSEGTLYLLGVLCKTGPHSSRNV